MSGQFGPSLCPSLFILKNMSKEAVRSGVKGAGGRVSSFPGALSGVKQSRKSLTLTMCANKFFRPFTVNGLPLGAHGPITSTVIREGQLDSCVSRCWASPMPHPVSFLHGPRKPRECRTTVRAPEGTALKPWLFETDLLLPKPL